MNIVFLMGNAYSTKDDYPLYLTELSSAILLEKQIDMARKLQPRQLIFCVNSIDIVRFHTDAAIKQLVPDAKIVRIMGHTKGAVCTALLAIEHIENDQELLLLGIDDFVEENTIKVLDYFRKNNSDAGLLSFRSIHPRYSFVKLNKNDEVIEIAEKRPISQNALVSFYYYSKGFDFVECAKDMVRKDNALDGNFYISETMNEMLLRQKKISLYKIKNEQFYSLKTQTQLAEYIAEHKASKGSR
ncbi:glycosyltransferase family 2 protein [Bartonella sp. TP]|uniref:glycosyltransferase family 2 protein n=1 Tax=Bartonella sp. TP TaxID=3057550 RepID=UPI0025B22C94|nr:glycosyltransferase family 2 protein [Bartonella sp. TP]MDN5249319.1 glycosyltransferase family 2 protein [Alphaproteobacteria bacterium]WJW79693.1 glycosyltransferase family 2 protein [Bartonella sp. TP]